MLKLQPEVTLGRDGFLSNVGSLLYAGFLLRYDSLESAGFLFIVGSLPQTGFLILFGSLIHYGFLARVEVWGEWDSNPTLSGDVTRRITLFSVFS